MEPTLQTFLGQLLSFVILVLFTMKFIWPTLTAAIEARQAKIAEGLAAADNSQKTLAAAQETADAELKSARVKANEIIDQAHQRASQILDHAKSEAVVEATRQKALAETEIEAMTTRAREDLRKQVSTLAVSGAEKLLKKEIDATAHRSLLDELAAQL